MITGDTIVAPATPYGMSGLAVVRISGPETKNILAGLTGGRTLPGKRKASLRSLLNTDGEKFEEALVTLFYSPASYTGEDLAEISVHGNPFLVQQTVDIICRLGARLAEPGEFTQRAFLNGRLDLIQAESVAALIHSRSAAAIRLNYRHLRGDLSDSFNNIKAGLMKLIGRVEWWLDISEDESDPEMMPFLKQALADLIAEVGLLVDTFSTGKKINEGYLVVIAGEPNVGKSTLMNALTGTDRAITSHIPGTTRDTLDYSFSIEGIPITLVDTAGLRETDDLLETKGIERTRLHLDKADLILNVCDEIMPFVPHDRIGVPIVFVHNKSDISEINIKNRAEDKIHYVSALNGDGINTLKRTIKTTLGISGAGTDILALTTARQHQALVKCGAALKNTKELLGQEPPELELVSVELHDAIAGIDMILGKTTPDEILNSIFGSFCVGK